MDVLLAKGYSGQNPTGWLMSEKLDGVRAVWTGSEFLSRNGKSFSAPVWFARQLPDVCLDGELWIARGVFQKLVGVVRKKTPVDADWEQVRFCVFDAPSADGGFESRLDFCRSALEGCAVAEVVEHLVCCGKSHLDEVFSSLVSRGAEGVMLRKPGSAYVGKRSDVLLKYKPVDSAEAVVIGHAPGEGRHLGRLGALVCRWRDVVFNVGTGLDDGTREAPPGLGLHVSFSFQGLTDSGVPRFPVFLGVRDYE